VSDRARHKRPRDDVAEGLALPFKPYDHQEPPRGEREGLSRPFMAAHGAVLCAVGGSAAPEWMDIISRAPGDHNLPLGASPAEKVLASATRRWTASILEPARWWWCVTDDPVQARGPSPPSSVSLEHVKLSNRRCGGPNHYTAKGKLGLKQLRRTLQLVQLAHPFTTCLFAWCNPTWPAESSSVQAQSSYAPLEVAVWVLACHRMVPIPWALETRERPCTQTAKDPT